MMPILDYLDGILYYPILVVVLTAAGLYFTCRTGLVQFRMFWESIRLVMEKPQNEGAVSPFHALMVSTASRVGTGNILGVSTAICLGGPGSVFWMWVIAVIGGASAFIESTLPRSIREEIARRQLRRARLLHRIRHAQPHPWRTFRFLPHHHLCRRLQYACLL
ncbi:MAG: alanine:cation symporter family protein [Dialister invisus]